MKKELDFLCQAELDANKKLYDKGQESISLLNKVVPLCAELVGCKEEAKATKAKMTKLEERVVEREVLLGKVEAELAAQSEAFDKAKADLINDVADAYAAGFEDTLAQVVCKHPEMDTSPFAASHRIVDGQIVPRRPPQ
uniref:Carbamoyl-phosphate synthase large subunit n=1 Tax=Phaseolus vulgaris TaxID=3885 RepID=I7APK7_PHAVU|nr:carbamoyl-phosphate synthase large subunit [Phaseolus vulgaris]